MLRDEEHQKEIERRKGAGNLSIPSPKDGEKILGFFGTEHRLYLYSQHGIYQVFTSDDVDPDVKEKDVPWVVNRYLNFGTHEKLFAYILGITQNICGTIIGDRDKQNDLRNRMLSCLVCANEISYAKQIYENNLKRHRKSLEGLNLNDLRDGTGLKIPTLETFEISFALFFSAIKRYLASLFSVCEWACDLQIGKGAKLDLLLNRISKKKSILEKVGNLDHLRRHENFVLMVNRLRNSYEHPTASNYVELRNTSFSPPNYLMEPAFKLVVNEQLDKAEWLEFSTNQALMYDILCSLTRDILIVIAHASANERFVYEAKPIPEPRRNKDCEIDCEFHLIGFRAP